MVTYQALRKAHKLSITGLASFDVLKLSTGIGPVCIHDDGGCYGLTIFSPAATVSEEGLSRIVEFLAESRITSLDALLCPFDSMSDARFHRYMINVAVVAS
jgi:hypothetical protein